MDVREKLVKLLDIIIQPGQRTLGDIADYLISNGVTVQEWISVKDRLPEYEGSYIVYTERGSVYANHFYTEKRFASGYVREAQWSRRGTAKVTHWQPMPQPGKENDNVESISRLMRSGR